MRTRCAWAPLELLAAPVGAGLMEGTEAMSLALQSGIQAEGTACLDLNPALPLIY